ncbi:NADH:flavin oxidoreductase [Streptomyces sp. NPDC088551]|uniref:NADH:flavin oxidoreductase n=1 Tax=Streptomyces sp. NPDC088551 TaxID=3365863 RepID=UPI00381F3211
MTPPALFGPARLGPLPLRNRFIKAATFEGMSKGALVSDELIDCHRRHAAGGVAMTTVAYCAVAPEGRTERDQIWMRPEAVPGLRRLTDAVHAEGAAVSAQLGHAGPVADGSSNGVPALGPSTTFNKQSLRRVRRASQTDIARITTAHADAALHAVEAGFNAVEIHLGHNYFASSFLSPKINKRKDEYGGTLEGRAKVARNAARAVRDAVGDRIAILAKLNMDDGVPGGLWLDESLQVAQWLEADGSVDALELTAGSSLLNPMYLFRGEAPLTEFAAAMRNPIVRQGVRMVGKQFIRSYPYQEAYLLESARQFRAALGLPLVLLGGVSLRETAERAMAEGFQFVAMGRALLREPDLINRMESESGTRSLCIHCNKCMPHHLQWHALSVGRTLTGRPPAGGGHAPPDRAVGAEQVCSTVPITGELRLSSAYPRRRGSRYPMMNEPSVEPSSRRRRPRAPAARSRRPWQEAVSRSACRRRPPADPGRRSPCCTPRRVRGSSPVRTYPTEIASELREDRHVRRVAQGARNVRQRGRCRHRHP